MLDVLDRTLACAPLGKAAANPAASKNTAGIRMTLQRVDLRKVAIARLGPDVD
jgi:hypothetical protein